MLLERCCDRSCTVLGARGGRVGAASGALAVGRGGEDFRWCSYCWCWCWWCRTFTAAPRSSRGVLRERATARAGAAPAPNGSALICRSNLAMENGLLWERLLRRCKFSAVRGAIESGRGADEDLCCCCCCCCRRTNGRGRGRGGRAINDDQLIKDKGHGSAMIGHGKRDQKENRQKIRFRSSSASARSIVQNRAAVTEAPTVQLAVLGTQEILKVLEKTRPLRLLPSAFEKFQSLREVHISSSSSPERAPGIWPTSEKQWNGRNGIGNVRLVR